MEIIGITGQTGAGKSTVCKALIKRGYVHIDADRIAKSLYQTGAPILKELQSAFGSQILTIDGELDKKALAAAAFANPAATETLNAIVHPAVTAKIRAILDEQRNLGAKAVIIDAIALFESGENALCDRTVGVIAPEAIRLQRIMARDHLTKEEALLRIRAQKDEDFYKTHCDAVLHNYPPYSLAAEIQRIFPL
ncbi:MAG: dephospho-CoA kinase [Candidatus Fimenecus sp.]